MSIPSVGTARVSHRFTNETNQELRVVMHALYDLGGSTIENDLRTLIVNFYANFAGPLQNLMRTSQSLVDADVYVWNGATLLFDPAGTAVIYVTGNQTNELLPPQVTWLGRWTTTNPRVVGTSYLPGVPKGYSGVGGAVDGSGTAALAAWMSNYLNPFTDGGGRTLTWGVWSRKNSVLYDITAAVTGDAFGTQRRRLLGNGA